MYKAIMTTTLVLALAGVSFAQEDVITPNLNEGTKELRLNGSYDGDAPLDYELTLGAAYGYFFMDNLEIAVEGEVQDNDLVTIFSLGAAVEYNFPLGGAWVPYIGAGGSYVGAEVDDDYYDEGGVDKDTAVGKAVAGVKYFLRNDVAISLRADYSYAADDIYVDEDGNVEDTNFKTLLGLRFYWD